MVNLLCDQHTSHLKHSPSTNYLGEKMCHMWTTQLGSVPHIYLPNAMTIKCAMWKITNNHIFDYVYILFAPSLLNTDRIHWTRISAGRHWTLMGLIFDRLLRIWLSGSDIPFSNGWSSEEVRHVKDHQSSHIWLCIYPFCPFPTQDWHNAD